MIPVPICLGSVASLRFIRFGLAIHFAGVLKNSTANILISILCLPANRNPFAVIDSPFISYRRPNRIGAGDANPASA
jgi:hypothetical protein